MTCQGCDKPLPPPPSRGAPPRKWCSERCRKGQYAEPCIDCGKPHGGIANQAGGHGRQRYCGECAKRHAGELSQERAAIQHAEWERFWREGLPVRVIAERTGVSYGSANSYVTKLRNKGVDLPYRSKMTPAGRQRISEAAKRARAAEKRKAAA